MNATARRTLAATLVLLDFLLAIPVALAQSNDPVLTFPSYFPLRAGAVYTYRISHPSQPAGLIYRMEVGKPMAVPGISGLVTPLHYFNQTSGGVVPFFTELVTSDAMNGHRVHGYGIGASGEARFDPPVAVPHGLTMQQSFKQTIRYSRPNIASDLTYSVTFAGLETVTVPAGTFRDCAKLVFEETNGRDTYQYAAFWAAGVGWVKGPPRWFWPEPGLDFDWELIAVSLPPVDLIGVALDYRVPADQKRSLNGPWPVNAPLEVTAVYANQGQGRAESFWLAFYLSTDAAIDPATDHLLGMVQADPLDAGGSRLLTLTLNENGARQFIPSNYNGSVWLGMVVDTSNVESESNESNNTLARNALLYDESLKYVPIVEDFDTQATAEEYLRQSGFAPPPAPILGRQPDVGWSKPLEIETFCRRFGKPMPPAAFRIHATEPRREGDRWVIRLQGLDQAGRPLTNLATRAYAGEPSPRFFGWGLDLLSYVLDYHERF